jgi:hypothetical protein
LEAAKQSSEDDKMVHNEVEATVIERGLEVLSEHGFKGKALLARRSPATARL